MSSFFRQANKAILDKTISRRDLTLEEFNIMDAWEFVARTAKKYGQFRKIILSIVREGDHYLIRMVAFNNRSEPICKSGDTIVGRNLIAYNLAENVYSYMDGKSECYLHVDTLLTPPVGSTAEDEDD